MADCSCGAPIQWARDPEGNKIKLDKLPSMAGPDRFREVGYNPLRVEPVAPTDSVSAYPRHDCERTR